MGIMELSRLGLLTFLVQGGCHSSEMGKERCKSKTVDNLGHTCLEYLLVLIFTPVSSCKSSPQSSGYGFRLNVVFKTL